ncbi:hypothetical protein TUBRATIS_008580 [Tubulinosema ratisbonensis]|uniref:Uncharacterized protein n=1 Tax=Tubulinosema ratisbonensis TaxID=291195 RepID=A0A437AN77_9MICR|nr:hypothetical protein TUBRATIS_008580 [Tubulinosema ratisbonensis]
MKEIPRKILQYEFFSTYYLFYCGYLLSSQSFFFYPLILIGYYCGVNHFIPKILLIFFAPFLPSYFIWIIAGCFYRIYQCLFNEESSNHNKNFILGLILGNIIEPNFITYFILSFIGIIILVKNIDLHFLQSSKIDKTYKLNNFYKKIQKNKISKDENNFNFLTKIIVDKILGVNYNSVFYISLSLIFGFLDITNFYKILISVSFLLPTPKFKMGSTIFFVAFYFDIFLVFLIPFCQFDFSVNDNFFYSVIINYVIYMILY